MRYLAAVQNLFPERPSGSARVAWDIANVMYQRGHDVTIFCIKQSPHEKSVSDYEGIRVVKYSLPQSPSWSPFKLESRIKAGIKSAQSLLEKSYDVVHIHTPIEGKIVYEALGQKPCYIYTVHSPARMEQEINWKNAGIVGRIKSLAGGRFTRIEKELLLQAQKIHTLSNFTKGIIDSFYGVGSKVNVIPHWCRPDFFREYDKQQARIKLGISKKQKVFFTIRRLAPRMGLDIAIKAIAPILRKHNDLCFYIGGKGVLEMPLKNLVKELGVESQIKFLGRLSDEDLKRFYEASDVFLLPTLELECFGLIVLEAFAYGLPVISTDAGAISELMDPILPDCVVPAGDVEAFREKINLLLDNKLEMRSEEELLDYVVKNFGRDRIIECFSELLENISV
jgi:glycosyltransferase involved in cell wall biosynthesis